MKTARIIRWLAVALVAIPALALAQAYTSRLANVRAGPDRSYPVVAQLAPDTPVDVMGCLSDYRWCDIAFGGNRGWIYAGSLIYPYTNGPVPLLTYGAVIGLPIITFSLGSYWDNYYRGRPWYERRDYWQRRPLPPHVRSPGPPARPRGGTAQFIPGPQFGAGEIRIQNQGGRVERRNPPPGAAPAPRQDVRPGPGRAERPRGDARPGGDRPRGRPGQPGDGERREHPQR